MIIDLIGFALLIVAIGISIKASTACRFCGQKRSALSQAPCCQRDELLSKLSHCYSPARALHVIEQHKK